MDYIRCSHLFCIVRVLTYFVCWFSPRALCTTVKISSCLVFRFRSVKKSYFLLPQNFYDNDNIPMFTCVFLFAPSAVVFGKNIVYDCPTSIMAQQLKWVRYGLGTQLMETYCEKIADEAVQFFNSWPEEGECDLHKEMSSMFWKL